MADVKAAREEVQKVVAFLVNRFGSQEDVFKHLTLALAHLQDDPAPKPEPEPAAEAVAEEPAVEEASEEPPSEEVAAPKPRKTRRYGR